MKTFKEFQENYIKTGLKIAAPFVGLGLLSQYAKKNNPLQKKRDKVQTKKQKDYEERTGTTQDDGYFYDPTVNRK
tara:strand:+ start:302 stop:526 length:225 start_codon:yes stop_codon:yes gene_type:complete